MRELTGTRWEDEYWTLILAVPVVLAFVPPYPVQRIEQGFRALEAAPEWFIAAVGASIAFAFGRQTLRGLRLPSIRKGPLSHPAQGAGT